MKNYTPQELQELYLLARNVLWRYRLDEYETATLKGILGTLDKAAREVKAGLDRYMVSRTQDERGQAMLAEFDRLTLAVRQQLTSDITEAASYAGEYATAEHVDILSFGGLVAPFNNVALSAAQFRQFFDKTPLGGRLLNEWVDQSFSSTVKAGMLEELRSGALQGEGYAKLTGRLLSDFELTKREATTLARTYVQTANVQAQEAVYAANADIVPRVKWCATLENIYSSTGRGTCLRCAVSDGREYPLKGPRPSLPLHPRCVTGDTRISAPGTIAAIRTKYRGPIIDIRLDNGRCVSVTENHRIMTGRGPMRAVDIQKGDKIIFDRSHVELSAGGENNYGLPPTAEEIFELFNGRFELFKTQPSATREDLHGDAQFIDGEIDIVAPKSLLRGDFESLFNNDLPDLFLPGPGVSPSRLAGLRECAAVLVAMGLSAQRVSRFLTVFDALSRSHACEPQRCGLGVISNVDTSNDQPSPDRTLACAQEISDFIGRHPTGVQLNDLVDGEIDGPWAVYAAAVLKKCRVGLSPESNALTQKGAFDWLSTPPEHVTDLFLGLPGSVELRDVEFVGKRSFDGHVYDLQTVSSTYYTEGMLSSNCRCVYLPVTATYKELGIDLPELEAAARPYTKRPDKNIDTGGRRTIEEVGQHQGDYASWFEKQPKAFQLEAVGPKRFELLRAGLVEFADLVDASGNLRTLDQLAALRT